MASVRSATPTGCRARPAQAWGLLYRPSMSGVAVLGSQHCHRPKGIAGSYPSFQPPGGSPRVDLATMVLLDQRPCRMIAESGAPARARATRPTWLETALFTAMAVNPHSP